jgi:hypothetical protein
MFTIAAILFLGKDSTRDAGVRGGDGRQGHRVHCRRHKDQAHDQEARDGIQVSLPLMWGD